MVTMERFCIHYKGRSIPFELQAKKKPSRHITIKVKLNGRVIVSAPPHVSHDEVIRVATQRAQWIYSKVQWFAEQQKKQPTLQYVSGEYHWYLGEKYVLQVVDSAQTCPQVRLAHRALQVILDAGQDIVRQALLNWYKQQAWYLFNQRLDALLPVTSWVTRRPILSLRFMKSRWGSCSAQGKISLNIHLVKAPLACIDYVILHELCHIAEHNHGTRFYQLMEQVSPNWKEAKVFLNKQASQYLV